MTNPNPFDDENPQNPTPTEVAASETGTSPVEETADDEEFEETEDEGDEADSDLAEVEDLDVDAPEADDSEKEEVPTDSPAAPGAKADKAAKAPARPPVAEGLMSPVAFAKFLTDKLAEAGVSNSKGPISKDNPITSQMVYSYINNSTREGSRNPFPIITDQEKTGGRKMAVNPQEALAWWLAKNDRVAASKANAAEKAKKKEENAKAAPAETSTTDAAPAEVVEAE